MLLQLRNMTRGVIAYVLLFLLAAAFALWGVNDVFSGVGGQNLAQVGGRSITPAQLTRELDLTLRQLRREGNNITQTAAIEAGLHQRVLDSLISRAAMAAYAERIGVSASDVQVAQRIRDLPPVQNSLAGGFDQAAYDQFLRELGYSRPEFEAEIRNELTLAMLMDAMSGGMRAPSSYGALLLAYETERRTVSIAEAPMSLAGSIDGPNDAQLLAFYEDSAASLTLPEYRSLTLVRAAAADFAARVSVPEERLRAEFEARSAALTQPERRSYLRIAATTEAQARDAVARLGRGEAPETVAQAIGAQLLRGEDQTREQIADSAVAEAVFAMAANAPARAVQGQLAPWTVVRVTSVTQAQAATYASQRDQLRQEIALEEASDMLHGAIATFEEAGAGGASIADAARTAGLATTQIEAIDAQGRDRQGQPVEGLPEDMVEVAFETNEGEASDFLPVGEADVVIAVDRVLPSSVRPLEDVRDQLSDVWLARERVRRLRELGDEVTEAVAGGQTFAAAARARRMNVVVASRPIARAEAAQIPAQQLGGLIFSARAGQVLADMRADGGVLLVAMVEQVDRADPAASPELVEAGRLQAQQSLQQSLDEVLQAEMVTRGRARRNTRLIDQIYGSRDDETAP